VGEKSVVAIGFELFLGNHFVDLGLSPRFFITMRCGKRRVRDARQKASDRRWGIAGIGDAGIFNLFSGAVNGIGGFGESGAIFPEFWRLPECRSFVPYPPAGPNFTQPHFQGVPIN
jgi:hypothetical protein